MICDGDGTTSFDSFGARIVAYAGAEIVADHITVANCVANIVDNPFLTK